VTVVFLPLSSIAAILGMNTSDMRNMETSQWVFWAVAIPLTVFIVTLCLIYTGELQNVWKALAMLRSGRGRRATFSPLSHDAPVGPTPQTYSLIRHRRPRTEEAFISARGPSRPIRNEYSRY
jgi:hypothetical protein